MRIKIIFSIMILISKSLFGQDVSLVSPELNKFQNIRDFCVSADGKEAYFSIQSPNQDLSQIVCVKNKKWSKPVLASFCDKYTYLEPFLSKDGKILYFASDRPKTDTGTLKSDFDIWYVERKNIKSKWSEPINIGSQVNSENDEFYPTLSDNNNLYFTMDSKSGLGKDDIYFCKWNETGYSKPILLDKSINSEGYEFNAYISNNETFLIYTRYNTKDGLGSGDLYISKKDEKGAWSIADNLGNLINTKYMEYCPFYDQQNNTLYFTSRRSNLLPKQFKNTKEYQTYISEGENGLSKIYKCKIKFE